ncbi:ARM repeat-containing protein [Cristinia sonorae]|uniref:ARM repeat-containing protein n=1 Tax=Cristinia sonorae TaxID=1940300 RepID=A0A8K0XNW6_9AGAR|nr:ARM repeat-containing protein [Cristinia sonorae]
MDGPPPQEEDFSQISISDRLAHKNWKARVSAYESLVKTFQNTADDSDPAFRPYLSNPDLLKKIALDANAVAQEKGVECLVAFVKFAGESAARTREAVVPALVDKCLGSTRAGTKNHSVELILQYVEVENGAAGVINDLLPGLGAKQPKAVAGCVTALKEIVRVFGTAAAPPAPILKALPKIFSHTDKTVRAEGTLLTHALYQYIGAGIDSWLSELKPVQVKELKEAFEAMDAEGKGKGTLKPERLTRNAAREAEAKAATGEADDGEDGPPEEEAPPDPRMFAEEVNIIPKLPANLQASLGSSKWKERKEGLDELLTLLNATQRIQDAPELGELSRSLAHCIQKDANIACVMAAANCLEALAKGVMAPFGRFHESLIPPMLERMKERKATVTDAIGAALDAIFATTSLPDVLQDILPAFSSKNPQVKEGTLKFFGRCLSTATSPVPPPQIKPVSEALASLLEDSFEGARNEAATCLGTLMKMVGERPLNALMDGLADVRKAKVKEAHEKATVKCKAGAAAPPKPAAPAAKEPPKKKAPPKKPDPEPIEDEAPPAENKPVKKPPARLLKKAAGGEGEGSAPPAAAAPPAVKKVAPPAAGGKSKPPPPAAPGALDTFKYKHTSEDAEALAADMIPANFHAGLGDANWKTRLATLEEMTEWVQSSASDLDSEVVVRFLGKKGWGEKNFQVSAKLYGILGILAQECPSFGRSSVALCIPHLSEKLGDMKLKKPAGETLLLFAEQTSLQFVLGHTYDPLGKQKAPKVIADAVSWMDQALTEFGIAGLSLRSLIEFLKTALKNSNAAVRTSATKTLVTVKLFAGPSVKDLLEDLNPQLLNTIIAEFDKVEGNPAPEPTRTAKDVAATAASSGGGKSAAAPDALDDLFPRVEIDNLLKGTTILADAKSDAWKTKKEALETLQAILDQGANKRLKPNMGEIAQVLKARLTDSNKAVQMLALDIVARIATGMGKPFEKQTRFFTLPTATVLSDQKAPIRAAALQTLTAMATACESLDSMISNIASAMESTNPLQKATLFNWLADWFKTHEASPSLDLSGWTAPIVSSLDDRNGDVRKGAQAILPTLVACAGYDYVMHATNSLKPASRNSAIPLIQAARAAAAPPPAPAKSATNGVSKPAAKVAAPRAAPAPASKLTGVRKKLPQGSNSRPESRAETPNGEGPSARLPSKLGGLKRPGAAAPASVKSPVAASPAGGSAPMPFHTYNMDAKRARLAKDSQRWVNEAGTTRKDLAELLQHQMEPNASKDLTSLLFSHDHNAVNDHVAGLTMMQEFFIAVQNDEDKFKMPIDDAKAVCIANSDLALKYVSMKAHEPQSNLVQKCLDVVEAVLGFLSSLEVQISEQEAMCFIPTMVYKLGDAREPVRVRVQQIMQSTTKVFAYSRVAQILLDHGLKSKVAKTRQGTLDEVAGLLKKFGTGTLESNKAYPQIAAMISDKDPQVRKSALAALSEGYVLVGEKIWSLVGSLSPKDKTQLEERLRRVEGPATPHKTEKAEAPAPAPAVPSRLATGIPRSGSPGPAAMSRIGAIGGIPRPSSPAVGPAISRLARPVSPSGRSSPAPSGLARPASPAGRSIRPPGASQLPGAAAATSPSAIGRSKMMAPSRLGPPKTTRPTFTQPPPQENMFEEEDPTQGQSGNGDDITITISSILSNDAARSVDALKKIQKVLEIGPEDGPSSPAYQELSEHTEGLIETITLQMAHVFERPDDITVQENFRLAKHLIQTLNAFCDHSVLAESLTVDILTSLLEELTLRLLQTDTSPDSRVKDLSRFINMIILRLFATGRRMSVFRALFALLLQIVKPFPASGTSPDSQEAKVAELVLKCVWKLARSIPQDLEKQILDPVELFPAIEHFLQSVPPNEWRARATNKVPCGDMPLRTIKVIIQHVVAHYAEDVYDLLSASFDDPSATIVYPYVYRILNSSTKTAADVPASRATNDYARQPSPSNSRPISPQGTVSSVTSDHRRSSSHGRSQSVSSAAGHRHSPSGPAQEPDLDEQLTVIMNHIASETTGAMHKEGITELHHFLKAYPHKKPKVDKMLDQTGMAFRKYITRALATRAAEDEERNVAVAHTLSKLESNNTQTSAPASYARDIEHPGNGDSTPTSPRSPHRSSVADLPPPQQEKLSRLHDLFQYRSSVVSNGSSHGRTTPSAYATRFPS